MAIERVVPGKAPEYLYHQHLERYRFASRFVTNKNVLDVACGVGYGAPLLCRAGANSYRGVDISREAIAIANRRYRTCDRIEFCCDNACSLTTVRDRTIDVAVSFETVEHLMEPRGFLCNLHRVLRPGGLLLISTPNRYLVSPGNKLGGKPLNPFHIREWDEAEFIHLLKEFFDIREFLGQEVYPAWKAQILHQAGRRRFVRCMLDGYLAIRRLGARFKLREQHSRSLDVCQVQALRTRQSPAYFVVVAAARRLSKVEAFDGRERLGCVAHV